MTMCVKVGDGYQGWPECGPFDAVIVTAALGHVPPPLIEQLKVGGRLIMPLGPADAPQQLTVIEKIAPSETQTRSIILVQFVPLTRSLSAGTIDAAIDVLLPLPEKIRRQRLGTEWLRVVARRRHPKVVGTRSAFAVPHLPAPIILTRGASSLLFKFAHFTCPAQTYQQLADCKPILA